MLVFKGQKYRDSFGKITKTGVLCSDNQKLGFEYIAAGMFRKEINLLIDNATSLHVNSYGIGKCFREGGVIALELKRKLFRHLMIVNLNGQKLCFSSVEFIKLTNSKKYIGIKDLGCVEISDEDVFFGSFYFKKWNEGKLGEFPVNLDITSNAIPFLLLSLLMIDISDC